MPIVVFAPTRIRLRKFLEEQIKLIEKGESSQVHKPLLRKAVEGLLALDYGESQPMFVPDKKRGHDGTRPYTLRKLKMQALGYADLLIAKNYKGKNTAIRTVAEAYGLKADRFRGWRKSPLLGKTNDPLMKSYRKKIASNLNLDKDHILDELTKAGTKYRQENKLAHTKKK